MCGATVHKRRGGQGILGGVVGGVVSYVSFGIVMYMRAYLNPQPDTVDYLGPGLSFILLSCSGALIGLAVGALFWGLMSFKKAV